MHETKPCHDCDMPAPGTPLRCLVLNGSLKRGDDLSNSEELSRLVLENMASEHVAACTAGGAERSTGDGT